MLFVVGEERGSDGADVGQRERTIGSQFLINGEPTDSKLAIATRGNLRVRLRATGRAAHSAAPEQGVSAIDKLLDALMKLRTLPLPSDPELGKTYYSIGLIEGGVAPNVISPHASAEVMFRTVGPPEPLLELLGPAEAAGRDRRGLAGAAGPDEDLGRHDGADRRVSRSPPTSRCSRPGVSRCFSARARSSSPTRPRSTSTWRSSRRRSEPTWNWPNPACADVAAVVPLALDTCRLDGYSASMISVVKTCACCCVRAHVARRG